MQRITSTKRRAMVVLFLGGWSFKDIARVFRMKALDVEQVVREWSTDK